MKKLRKLVLILGISGPVVVNLSCSSALFSDARDAVFGAVSMYIADTTLEVLDGALNPGGA